MSLANILDISRSFVLFMAPPAWGKTRMLLSLARETDKKIIYISPLRALALEFFSVCKQQYSSFYISSFAKAEKSITLFRKRGKFLIVTPELFDFNLFSTVELDKYLIVIDEVHLFFSWGSSFRPILLENLYGVLSSGVSVLTLTATTSPKMREELRYGVTLNFDNIYEIDIGNRKLKYNPSEHYFFGYLGKRCFDRVFVKELILKKEETILYFCRYRYEVERWINFCNRNKIPSLGCIGGQVDKFVKDMKQMQTPRCIFATSVLGHGVNLPSINRVFISYRVGDFDFWLQMVGRGGRDGNRYSLYTIDKYNLNIFAKVFKTIQGKIMEKFVF